MSASPRGLVSSSLTRGQCLAGRPRVLPFSYLARSGTGEATGPTLARRAGPPARGRGRCAHAAAEPEPGGMGGGVLRSSPIPLPASPRRLRGPGLGEGRLGPRAHSPGGRATLGQSPAPRAECGGEAVPAQGCSQANGAAGGCPALRQPGPRRPAGASTRSDILPLSRARHLSVSESPPTRNF